MAKRGLKFPNGFVKTKILEYAIENWEGFYENDLREYLRTIKYKLENGEDIEGVKDTVTIKKHLKELKERGYLELIRESDGYYSNFWRINSYKLYDAVKDFETFGKFTKDLLSFMQESEEILDWIYENTNPKSSKEFLRELIKTNPSFLKWIIRCALIGSGSTKPLPHGFLEIIADLELRQGAVSLGKEIKKIPIQEIPISGVETYVLFTIWRNILIVENVELNPELEELITCTSHHGIENAKWIGYFLGISEIADRILSEEELKKVWKTAEESVEVIYKNNLVKADLKSIKDLNLKLKQTEDFWRILGTILTHACLEKLIKNRVITKFDEDTIYIAQELGIVDSGKSEK
ncbi:hypothetical protein DRP05_15115 [Archaeoglobales archaeon]|nr:MAG: hypothetical protein DRP05_15115 [Archaeoglobales archaeon]